MVTLQRIEGASGGGAAVATGSFGTGSLGRGSLDDERRLLAVLRRGGRAEREAGSEAVRAAEALLESTYRRTYATLLRLCGGDADLAADLTQETYRKAWSALAGFDGRARLSTWLFRIAYTTFLNHARRPRLFVPAAAGDEAGDEPERPDGASAFAGRHPAPDEALAASQDRERLRRAVLGLPEDLRYTVTACFWGELPVREIARHEGITGAAVRKRLRKATSLLAAQLEEDLR